MSSSEGNFNFDPNLFMKLANLNEEMENFKASEISLEVNEDELLVIINDKRDFIIFLEGT